MCAIVDANVGHQLFGNKPSEAGAYFLDWLTKGRGKLVVGSGLRQELEKSEKFKRLLLELVRANKAIDIQSREVIEATKALQNEHICKSNDQHVLALAKVSGARLLFTNDRELQIDFKNRQIIDGVQGRVYTTLRSTSVTRTHKDLLRRRDLCGTQGSE